MTFWSRTEPKQIGIWVGQIHIESTIQTGGSCLVAVRIIYDFQLLGIQAHNSVRNEIIIPSWGSGEKFFLSYPCRRSIIFLGSLVGAEGSKGVGKGGPNREKIS